MIKKPVWTSALKRRFIGYVDKWRGLLMMNGYHINVHFSEVPDKEHPETCSAETAVNDSYLSGHKITIFPRMLREPDRDEQERKIIHELCHIITEPSKELTRQILGDKYVTWREVKDANERATDWIANIAFTLHEGARSCPAKEVSSHPRSSGKPSTSRRAKGRGARARQRRSASASRR